ncbi:MAG: TetR/AcrR family transcriptional regulator [Candidatus Eisenbacteria bacterium]|uniref:TetR/AcrR family transcriptional regulator n=1 Tax=Eiseniibacteriota bacterium TaxID=2212470 RepID=A0A538SRW5_UNCEI|nr:MAG: TetR/AcrR family transcriptional regulator [Candidatus Eisenbacteria bacterium]TMQ65872.1 MAG: TetR/AcrR family transcriptional regulator [Candidatus Eisenbacteria bacterium]
MEAPPRGWAARRGQFYPCGRFREGQGPRVVLKHYPGRRGPTKDDQPVPNRVADITECDPDRGRGRRQKLRPPGRVGCRRRGKLPRCVATSDGRAGRRCGVSHNDRNEKDKDAEKPDAGGTVVQESSTSHGSLPSALPVGPGRAVRERETRSEVSTVIRGQQARNLGFDRNFLASKLVSTYKLVHVHISIEDPVVSLDSKNKQSPWPKPRLKAPDRRSQILAAALEVFAEQGFHGTPTRELARRAGVSEALVFQHFPTKEDLIRAIIEHVGFEERIQFMESHLAQLPPRQALKAIAEHLLTNLRERPDLFRVVFFGIMETPHLAREFYQKFLSRLLALETRLFERAFAERAGGLPAARVDPAVVARSFHGSLIFYNLAGAIVRVEPLPSDPRATAEAIVNIYLPEVEK